MGIIKARTRVRRAVEAGRSIDWIDQNIIECTSLSRLEKGALYLDAFAQLTKVEQARVVRESFALALQQVAPFN